MPENSNRGRLPDAAALAAAMGMEGRSAREARFQRVSGEVPRPTVVVSSAPSQPEQRKALVTAGPTPSIPLDEMLAKNAEYKAKHTLPDTSGALPRTRREIAQAERAWRNPEPERPSGVDDPTIVVEAVSKLKNSGIEIQGVTGLGPTAGVWIKPAKPGEISSPVRGGDDTETAKISGKRLSDYHFSGENVTAQDRAVTRYYLQHELVRDPFYARFHEEALPVTQEREAQVQALFGATVTYAKDNGYDISDRLPADVVLVSPQTMRKIAAARAGIDNPQNIHASEIPSAMTWGTGSQIIFYTEKRTVGDTLETLQHEIDHAIGLSAVKITDSELIPEQSGYQIAGPEYRQGTEQFRQFNETIVQLMTLRKRAEYWGNFPELREFAGIPDSTVYFSNLVTGTMMMSEMANQTGLSLQAVEKILVGGYYEGNTEQLRHMIEQTYGPKGVNLVANWRDYGSDLQYGIQFQDTAQTLMADLHALRSNV